MTPGDALHEPRVPVRGPRAGAELLDEHHPVAHVVHGKAPAATLPRSRISRVSTGPSPAGELAVAQAVAVETEVAVVDDLSLPSSSTSSPVTRCPPVSSVMPGSRTLPDFSRCSVIRDSAAQLYGLRPCPNLRPP